MADPDPDIETELAKIDVAILEFETEMEKLGAYMPSLATYLRLHADELADRYADDTNGGER